MKPFPNAMTTIIPALSPFNPFVKLNFYDLARMCRLYVHVQLRALSEIIVAIKKLETLPEKK